MSTPKGVYRVVVDGSAAGTKVYDPEGRPVQNIVRIALTHAAGGLPTLDMHIRTFDVDVEAKVPADKVESDVSSC